MMQAHEQNGCAKSSPFRIASFSNMASSEKLTPILLCYDISIYSSKMDYYMGLWGLKYIRCIQFPRMPRLDLKALEIN